MNSPRHAKFILLSGLLILAVLSGCVASAEETPSIGVISNSATADGATTGSLVAQEQEAGYAAGLKEQNLPYVLQDRAEGNQQDDVQTAIRNLVEKDRVVAVFGATSDQASVRAASLVNFFNVPMIVPSTYGENILPSNNLWAFRLSPPSSAYAGYLFGEMLPLGPSDLGGQSMNDILPNIKIAILYEQNTFGESAAVATADVVLEQEMQIGVYGSFNATSFDADKLRDLVDKAREEQVHIIYLISSDPAIAVNLVRTIVARYDGAPLPALIGQAGGFGNQAFITSPEADSVFVVRQQLDVSNCPTEIRSITSAQTYAAVYLLDRAIQVAAENAPTTNGLQLPSLGSGQQTDPLVSQRERVRDALKATSADVPCLGQVAFDNTGQNRNLRFELMRVQNGVLQAATPDQLFDAMQVNPAETTPSGGSTG